MELKLISNNELMTRGLGYSEGSAYRRLQSARLLKQVPTVADKIEQFSELEKAKNLLSR